MRRTLCSLLFIATLLRPSPTAEVPKTLPEIPAPQTYAILLQGSDEEKFNSQRHNIYESMKQIGIPDDNIYILANEKIADGSPQLESIEAVVEELEPRMTPYDTLLFTAISHGTISHGKYSEGLVSRLSLPGTDLWDNQPEGLLNRLPGNKITFIEGCHTGGFSDMDLPLVVTASRIFERSWYGLLTGGFIEQIFLALNDTAADRNGDNRVSLGEAYRHAHEAHFYTRKGRQTPYISNMGLADNTFIEDGTTEIVIQPVSTPDTARLYRE